MKLITGILMLIVLRQCICQQDELQDCQDDVEITNCKDGKFPRPWKKKDRHYLTAHFVNKCKRTGRIEYRWEVHRMTGDDQTVRLDDIGNMKTNPLRIKRFVLSKGKYYAMVYAFPAGNPEQLLAPPKSCDWEVQSENPIPILTGGSEKTVKASVSFIVDGQKSRSMDNPKEENSFQFRWKCTVVKGDDKSFCKKTIPAEKTVSVPKQYAKPGYEYIFTLSVKNSDSKWISTTQVVKVKENVVSVKIVCMTNCFPLVEYTDVTSVTSFEAFCRGGRQPCDKAGLQYFQWTLEGQKFNYDSDTESGRNDSKFEIKKNVLEPGKTYQVRVDVWGTKKTGSAVEEFKTKKPPSVQSCTTDPKSGVASETIFAVSCTYEGNGTLFEIYSSEKGSKQNSNDQVKQISSIMAVMVDGDENNPDPDIGEKASEICKKIALKLLEHAIEDADQPNSFDAHQTTMDLMKCAASNNQEDADLLKAEVTVHVETPFPPLPEPAIPEDYPDYQDDEKAVMNIDKLEVAAQNSVDICILNAKTLAATISTDQGAVGASTKFCEVNVTKSAGDELVGTLLTAKGITVRPSPDFIDIADDITSTICIWKTNPFWWMSGDIKIHTNVALVKFSDQNNNDYAAFRNPVIVSFNVTEGTAETKIHDVAFPTPGRYASEEDLSVVRIEAKKGEAYLVRFHLDDLQRFRMLITNFNKPTFKQVQSEGILVDKANGVFYQENSDAYDGWDYISMLPENEETKKQSQYRISVYTSSCYTWNMKTRGWSFGCRGSPNSNSTVLECQCSHLSVLAGLTYNNNIQIEKTTKYEFAMVLIVSYGILIRTSLIFAFYCFLILFIRRKKREVIYILPDVSRFARYLYVVVVQTGFKSKAGTTSNVSIKLYGTRGASKEHVLNYPDPQGRMLQSGNLDFFALTTEFHLGDLTKIDLWFDCIGRRSSWYCDSVMVYDAQTHKNWYFEVQRWLSLQPHNVAHVTVELANKELVDKKVDLTKRQACAEKCKRLVKAMCSKKPDSDRDTPSPFAKDTIMLSVFVTLYGLTMIMYGMPLMQLRDGFTTFEKKFHWTLLVVPLASAFITFIAHIILIWLWKHPRRRNKVLLWSALTFNVVFWMTALVVLGFWMPLPKMWMWLIGSVLALGVYYLVLFNVYRNVRRVGRTAKTMAIEILDRTKNLVEIVDAQRRFLFKEFGGTVLRPYLTHLYRPLNEEEKKYKRDREESKMRIFELVVDVVMFLMYIALLYLVILANKDSLTIVSYQKMLELLAGEFTRSKGFDKIGTIDDIYDYLNNTLIPAMQSLQWYGKFVVDDPGTMKDFDNKYMGVVRLRQHKVIEDMYCLIPPLMHQFESRCLPEFNPWTNDDRPFGTGISPHERMASAWNYSVWSKAGTFPAIGTMSEYPGGGYIAPLGRTMTNSIINLNYLRRKKWITSATRAIFIEFIAYNANANLFNAVRVLVEYSATGAIHATHNIKTARLLFLKGEINLVKIVIWGAFVVVLIVFAIKLFHKLWFKRKIFLRDIWLAIDFAIVILSCSCFVLFAYRMTLVHRFLEAVEEARKNEFVNYFTLFRLEDVLTTVAAILVCIATIRLWKLLRFGTVFLIVEKTIFLSVRPILALLLYQVLLLFAFALTAFVVFGSHSSQFKDLFSSIVTLVLLSLNLGHKINMEIFTDELLGSIFFGVYMVTSLFTTTVYIVIICMSYSEAQTQYSNSGNAVKSHLKSEIWYFKNWLMMKIARLRGGDDLDELDEPQRVTPKSDEHRYANCLTMPKSKLELMSCVVLNLLDDQQMSDERKIKLMLHSAKVSMQKESDAKEICFKTQNEDKTIKLMHDNKMVEMANMVEGILGKAYLQEQYVEHQYQRIINRHMRKLKHIQEVLEVVSKVFDNIKLDE